MWDVVKKLIKEEAMDACARLHSGIRLTHVHGHTVASGSMINEVIKDSTEKEDNDERNQTDNDITNKNKEASIGGGGFSMPSPNNCKGCIDSAIR